MPEILKRIDQIIKTNLVDLRKDFKIYWNNYSIAKLQKGKDYLSPEIDLIIDDMIDTAGTTVNASKAAMDKGAKSVTAVATHGVLSGPAIKRLNDSDINKIIITDTISIDKEKKTDKIKIVSVAKIFGEAVNRVHNGESVSALFEF